MFWRSLILTPYLFVLSIGFLLPSDGQHGMLNVKSLAILCSAATLALTLCQTQRFHKEQFQLSYILLGAGGFLAATLLYATLEESLRASQWDLAKLLLATLYVPLATTYLIQEGFLTAADFYKYAMRFSFCYIVVKLALIALHLFHWINLWEVLELVGFRFMRMHIFGSLERLQTSADFLTPFMLYFVLQSDRSRFFKILYTLLSFVATFLSFSRVLLAIYVAALLLHWCTLKGRAFLSGAFLLFATTLSLYFLIGPTNVHHMIDRRFTSKDNSVSDQIRSAQIDALTQDFLQAPLLGQGIGSPASTYTRDNALPHHYEVQWLSLLNQFGLLLIFPLLPCLLLIAAYLNNPPVPYATLSLLILFLLSGFTNPYLLSLASGILYTLFLPHIARNLHSLTTSTVKNC